MQARDGLRTRSNHHTVAEQVVGFACWAPSVHNTQPWSWRALGREVELHQDPSRRLEVEDPVGRNQIISCGAALHYAEEAARALGWAVEVARFPEGLDSTLLARLRFSPGGGQVVDQSILDALLARRTDRRRFTRWPVPEDRLRTLVEASVQRGAQAQAVTDEAARFRLWLLVERSRDEQLANPLVRAEQHRWMRSPASAAIDGVPSTVVPQPGERGMPHRFSETPSEDRGGDLGCSDGAVVLGGHRDVAPSWLRVGEALSALWLPAGRAGLSVVPLSQPVEVERTRTALMEEVLASAFVPHLVVRIGWQALGRGLLPRTPRRPLVDVLLH